MSLGYRVAIKYMHRAAAKDREAVQRFMREAWAASQIKSSHAVRVSDVASLPSGAPFIVMEYLDGEDLAQLLERRATLSVSEAVGLLLQVCESIAEAHSLGIVHRDLKPSNIFCARGSAGRLHAKVLDFGISKLMNGELSGLSITTTRTALGSPLYMSPEQMHSAKVVDVRTDIWSLGVIFYELVTGNRPFDATSLPELAIRVATEAPRPPRELCPSLPRGLERIVLRCLEKDRTRRYPNVNALVEALSTFATETPRLVADRANRASTAPVERKRSERFLDSLTVRARQHALVLALLASAAIAAFGYFVASPPPAWTAAAAAPASGQRVVTAPALVEIPKPVETKVMPAPAPAPAAIDQALREPVAPTPAASPAPRRAAGRVRTPPKPRLPAMTPAPNPPPLSQPVVAEVQPVRAEPAKASDDSVTPETFELGGRL